MTPSAKPSSGLVRLLTRPYVTALPAWRRYTFALLAAAAGAALRAALLPWLETFDRRKCARRVSHSPRSMPAVRRGGGDGAPLRILLVEDHVDTAMMQAAVLEIEGHIVELAGDGLTAVNKALLLQPDVILLDIGLPGLDGYEVAKRVRQAGLRATLIIALTGYGREQDILKAREVGIDHHLLKPVNYERLTALLMEHGRRQRDEQAELGI